MKSSLSRLTSAVAAALLIAPALQAQGPCTLAGTWYGGGEATKYLMTVTHDTGVDYTLVFNGAYTLPGVAVFTPATGSIIKKSQNRWEAFAIGLSNTAPGVPAPFPDLMAVHATVRLIDCNTMTFDYDFFGGYYASSWQNGKVPFVDPPDPLPLPPTPFTETYQRMPISCPIICGK